MKIRVWLSLIFKQINRMMTTNNPKNILKKPKESMKYIRIDSVQHDGIWIISFSEQLSYHYPENVILFQNIYIYR